MAMAKTEMEKHRTEYRDLVSAARAALQHGLYREAIDLAISSWDHIDGMMRFERKYNNWVFVTLEGIDIVLKWAPLLFDFQSLDKLGNLLKSQRGIVKNTPDDLAENLSRAKTLMWEAHRLWNHLERQPESRQDELRPTLGGDQDQWRSMAETWEQMGLVRRSSDGRSYRLALATQMEATVLAKCPSCGAVVKAPKTKLLEHAVCPKCRAKVLFVLLSREPNTSK